MSVFELYLITTFTESSKAFGVLGFLLAICATFGAAIKIGITYDEHADEGNKQLVKVFPCKTIAVISFLFLLTSFLSPSYKQLAIIYSGSFATNNAEAKQIPDNAMKVLNKFMQEYLNDGKQVKGE